MKNRILLILVTALIVGCATAPAVKKTDGKQALKKLDPPEKEKYSYQPVLAAQINDKTDNDIYDTKPAGDKDRISADAAARHKTVKYGTSNKTERKTADSTYKKKNVKRYVEGNTVEKNNRDIDLATVSLEKFRVDEKPFRNIQVNENQKFSISLAKPGWIVRKLFPHLIKITGRESRNTNTLFHFQSGASGNVSIVFLRYDAESDSIWRQAYSVSIMPRLFSETKSDTASSGTDESSINESSENPAFQFNDAADESSGDGGKTKKKDNPKEDTGYRLDMANRQFDEKKYDEAAGIYNDLINAGESTPEINYKLGIIQKAKGSLDRSNGYFRNILSGGDDVYYADALIGYLKNLQEQKKYHAAIDAYYKYGGSKSISPRDAEELELILADTYYGMKDYRNAGDEYRRFMKKYPSSGLTDRALYFLASSLENLKSNPDFREARRLYSMITSDYPESVYYDKSRDRILYLDRHYLKIN